MNNKEKLILELKELEATVENLKSKKDLWMEDFDPQRRNDLVEFRKLLRAIEKAKKRILEILQELNS